MKKFQKKSIATVVVAFFVFAILGLISPNTALAATKPTLGAAESFSILGAAAMSSASTTTVSGDLGLSPGLAISRTGSWVVGGTEYFGPASLAGTAQTAALGAYNNLVAQTTTGAWGVSPWSPIPGVWTDASSPVFAGTITLNGDYDDVWVFKISTDFTFSGDVILQGNAQACNVFWSVAGDATIGSGSNFVGTLIAQNDITSASGSAINGRIISLSGTTIAMNGANSSISGPTCLAAPSGGSNVGTINVVKHVINDSGGTRTVADFPLFVNGTPVVSGVTNTFAAPAAAYTVTETTNPGYTQTFSGDCDINGQLNLNPGDNKFCIITNDDIGAPVVPVVPPLIDVVKVPSPLSLSDGPGLVNYTYTLTNIGTVPVTDITMVGDTCSPITLTSGDSNSDSRLDLNETWVYTCSTMLTETHTNIVTATGWANGISAVDLASATVVVGLPIVPPLIHITKIPSPLALGAGGGMVTYTKRVTNPGTVPLSNVRVTDDKCSPISYISGDTNSDSRLDPSESWLYTCQSNLIATTTNTAIATGEANGLTARDAAIATVIVANTVPMITTIPTLPNTGAPMHLPAWMALLAGISVALFAVYFIKRRQTE